MKLRKWAALFVAGALCGTCLAGCGQGQEAPVADTEETFLGESLEDSQPFPRSDAGFVGDPMPFYNDGEFNVFYLLDERNGSAGYHPWALYKTSNFYEYEDVGSVIPYAPSTMDQDTALGTGSVIKDQNGLYHAFYTGHNDEYSPKEAVMHATSSDLLNWTKQPEDTLYSTEPYSQNDFRDPYVLYVPEESQYWMLVTTRSDNTGVIVKYTSADLKVWKDEGIFFVNDLGSDSNLECPSLLQFGGKWYLAFSDQWPNRLTHYRVADSINGPFAIPTPDVVDGNGFYAGRLETDGDMLYFFGWNATKVSYTDSNEYGWGGNLVVHQLEQREDGRLVPVLNNSIREGLNHEIALTPTRMTETVHKEENTYTCQGQQYEAVEFKDILGSYLFQTTVKNFREAEKFGFGFNMDPEAVGAVNIVFNVAENQVEFYNTNALYAEDPQSTIGLDMTQMEEIPVSILIGDGVVSLYVDGQCAMTTRMHTSQGWTWGMFAINGAVQFEDVHLYK